MLLHSVIIISERNNRTIRKQLNKKSRLHPTKTNNRHPKK
nr:MAG TPA: hypothetical protein [Caudoviricetes sp.]